LDAALPALKNRREREPDLFLIATDTSFPALLNAGIAPSAVISIDCQLWSFQHFRRAADVPLFLDVASPPLLAGRSPAPVFFAGGHPLGRLFAAEAGLPELDTSGGNVTYAAVSLAESLGAETVELYGADFSYPMGVSYARGTWLYALYDAAQTRLDPAETAFSAILYRTPLEKRDDGGGRWRYESPTLDRYRAALSARTKQTARFADRAFKPDRAKRFPAEYGERLAALSFHSPPAAPDDPAVSATLLPAAAALQSRSALTGAALLEAARELHAAKFSFFRPASWL
jgi:hypothetical protein